MLRRAADVENTNTLRVTVIRGGEFHSCTASKSSVPTVCHQVQAGENGIAQGSDGGVFRRNEPNH